MSRGEKATRHELLADMGAKTNNITPNQGRRSQDCVDYIKSCDPFLLPNCRENGTKAEMANVQDT